MRTLTISTGTDQDAWMEQFVQTAEKGLDTGQYQGEYLDFATPATFFSHLSAHRWNLLNQLVGKGTIGVRELARQVGRDIKRVHEDAQALVELGLVEKTERGALHCPYARIEVNMALEAQAA